MTPTREAWLPVVGYEGLYEVSDLGRVRSLDRQVVDRTGRTNRFRGRVMRPQINARNGRRMVVLSLDGQKRSRTVYSLVIEAFVGPCPPGMEACHNDGDQLNDQLGNLRWDTRSGNVRDAVRHGTHSETRKTACRFGHPLIAPNLIASRLPRRICLACNRARSNRPAGAEPHQVRADRYFAQISKEPQ